MMKNLPLLLPLVAFIALVPLARADDIAQREALAIFERRIAPIMNSPNPSSCAECHLSGVDLKNYLQKPEGSLGSPEKTFLSLRDQGLINVKEPAQSKILEFIRRGEPKSSRLTQQARSQELEAFQAWITACCKSETLVKAAPLAKNDLAAPSAPVEVIRHTRKDRVFDSFATNVWAQIERCGGMCHSRKNPNIQKFIADNGADVVWVQDTPEATLAHIIERKYVNVENPERSLLLLKPTMQVPHGGGRKMETGDQGYKQFRRFLEDYAASVNGKYQRVEQLPKESGFEFIFSDCWLKVTPTPDKWADHVLGVTIHSFDEKTGRFSPTPVAHSDRLVFGKGKLWQHNLILIAPKGSPLVQQLKQTRRLPAGRYLVRFFCDVNDELKQNWNTELIAPRFAAGQTEVTSDWPTGYGRMTVVAVQ